MPRPPPPPSQVSVAGLSLRLQRLARRREIRLQEHAQGPGPDGSNPAPGLSAESSSGCFDILSGGRSGSLWGGWGRANACPNWGDKAPQGELPVALGACSLWAQEEEQQAEIGSAGVEMETTEVELEPEGATEKQPQ